MNTSEHIAELNGLIQAGMVPPRNLNFAGSLVTSFNKYQKLSQKQEFWVLKLIEDAICETVHPVKIKKDIDCIPILRHFQKANESIPYPKLAIDTDIGPIVLKLAGSKSKYQGCVQLTGEGKYPDAFYYGRVELDGTWTCPDNLTTAQADAVQRALRAFMANPAAAATAFGLKHSSCCFCGKKLTDPKSVKVGFGPTCASIWGLPHG